MKYHRKKNTIQKNYLCLALPDWPFFIEIGLNRDFYSFSAKGELDRLSGPDIKWQNDKKVKISRGFCLKWLRA